MWFPQWSFRDFNSKLVAPISPHAIQAISLQDDYFFTGISQNAFRDNFGSSFLVVWALFKGLE